jgi:transposase InsO family protein
VDLKVREKEQISLLAKVKNIRKEHVKLGTLKLRHELRQELNQCGRGFGRDKFFDLLRANDLLIKRRRRYAVTTNSKHAFYKHTNQLTDARITAPDQAWVSDITYLSTRNKFVYLSLVTDVFSRKIVGWNVDSSLAVEGALGAINMALKGCSDPQDLIHHSDRGIQYCCHAYNTLAKAKGIKMSMGEAGNCYDNAIAERVNGILKSEYLLDNEFLDIEQAVKAVKQGIYLYNHKRPHWSLNLQKPAEVYKQKARMNYQGNQFKQAGLAHSKSKTPPVYTGHKNLK